jgi:hypothetical protein
VDAAFYVTTLSPRRITTTNNNSSSSKAWSRAEIRADKERRRHEALTEENVCGVF